MRKTWFTAGVAALALGLGGAAPPQEKPHWEATRTQGFFKTHEQALRDCLSKGPVNLGIVTIHTLEDALGLLWGSPARFESGAMRNTLDKHRFQLARQTLVGTCNQRLFGARTMPENLLMRAMNTTGNTDCDILGSLADEVTNFNESGEDLPFPWSYDPGPSTPRHARSIANDPTTDSGQQCTSELDDH